MYVKETERNIAGSENKLRLTENNLWYVSDSNGKRISRRCYKGVSRFKNGLAVATLNRTTKVHEYYLNDEIKKTIPIYPKGVIDVNGKEILKPIYDNVFISGKCIRICIDGLWGYASFEGKILNEPKYEFLEDFKDENARAYNGMRWGTINFEGETIIPFRSRYLGMSRDGKRVSKNNVCYGVLDELGNIVEPYIYDNMLYDDKKDEIILTNSKTGKTFIL